ncbi:hypothetical protein ACFZCY_42105 [Streptomyces sp. NPDC007983]|uniref:hypothetical protein n=1 Tax=Streptomyces sp. NPDC007983 TaxID=3364800 RepID=UPI0036EB4E27
MVKSKGSVSSRPDSSSGVKRPRMWVGISVCSYSGPFSAGTGARMYTYRPSVTLTCPPWMPNSPASRTGSSEVTGSGAPRMSAGCTLADGRRGIEPGDVTVLAGVAADALPGRATITVGAQVTRPSCRRTK